MPEMLGDLDALLGDVRRRAQQRALQIEDEARKRTEGILASARAQAEAVGTEQDRQTEKGAEALRRRVRAQGEVEAQRRFLCQREILLTRVWQETEVRLRKLVDASAYPGVLKRLALIAAKELGESQLTLAADVKGHILLSPDQLDAWGSDAGVVFERAPNAAEAWGGLLVWSGRTRYDATFITRLNLAKEVLRERVFRSLTSGQE